MKYDLKSPCAGCPFRENAAAGWLGDYTPEEVIEHIQREIPFLCHVHVENTTGYHDDSEDGDWRDRLDEENAQHCAGALIMARKLCKLPRDPDHNAAVRGVDALQPILFPPDRFIRHHRE